MSIARSLYCLLVPILLLGVAKPGQTEEQNPKPDILDVLLERKEQDGRENAAIYYVMASEKNPGWPDDEDFTITWRVGRDGWFPGAEKALHCREEYGPAMDLMRKGASVGYAWWPSREDVEGRYVNSPVLQSMFVYEAKYLEHQGKAEEALRNYLTLISFARDMTRPEASLIDHLIGIAFATRPLKGAAGLLRKGTLSRNTVQSTLAFLRELDDSWVVMTDGLRKELPVETRLYREAQTDPGAAAKELEGELESFRRNLKEDPDSRRIWPQCDLILEGEFTVGGIVADATRIANDLTELWDFELEYLEKPPWERDPDKYQAAASELRKSLHPYVVRGLDPGENFADADVRYRVFLGKLRDTQLAAAVELYRLDHDAAPRSLDQLVPEYLESIPIDPFTGKPMRYRPWTDEGGGGIYSLGPDREDDRLEIEYDVTNGTFSQGDVFLR